MAAIGGRCVARFDAIESGKATNIPCDAIPLHLAAQRPGALRSDPEPNRAKGLKTARFQCGPGSQTETASGAGSDRAAVA